MKSSKRFLAAALALTLLLSVGSFAMAEGDNAAIRVTATVLPNALEVSGTAFISLKIDNLSSVGTLYFSLDKVQIADKSADLSATLDNSSISNLGERFSLEQGAYNSDITVPVFVNSGKEASSLKLRLTFTVYDSMDALTGTTYTEYVVDSTQKNPSSLANAANIPIKVVKSSDVGTGTGTGTGTDGNGTPTATEPQSGFRITPLDKNGARVPAPRGNYGDTVKVRIPLFAKQNMSGITITPVITTSLDTFPFVISQVDYTMHYPGYVTAGQILEFEYDFTLSKNVTAGVKQIDFLVTATGYQSTGSGTWGSDSKDLFVNYSDKVSVFLTVVKGAPDAAAPGATPPPASTPKLIVESFSISAEKVYAGEAFDLTFTLRNTSETESIQNLQIHVADSTSTVLPANSGSNTLYIKKIDKGQSHTQTISLQTTPGAEAKAYILAVEMDYEAGSTKTAYKASESISIPVLQRIRVKADDPVVYDEAWTGSPVSMYTALYNLGKATLYNCAVEIEGDGLSMQEGYFGGNIAAGSTMRADFSIIPSVAGDINANVVITYEDVYGEQFEMKMPFNLFVNDMNGDGGMGVDPMPMPPDGIPGGAPLEPGMNTGLPVWAYIAIGLAVVGGVVILTVVLKRRRKKELEEL